MAHVASPEIVLLWTLWLRAMPRIGSPLDGLARLVRGQLRFPSKPHAARLHPLSPFRRAGADQVALELGQPAQHGQHQPPVGDGGGGPCVAKRPETGLALGDGGQRVQHVACRSGEAIDTRHHQHVAGAPDALGRSRMPQLGTSGAVRGAASNGRPYRERLRFGLRHELGTNADVPAQ